MDIRSGEPTRNSLAVEVLREHGSLRLQATGTSMLPSVWPGDHLLIHAVDIEQVRRGDIVLFSRDGRFFVHRVQRTCTQAGEVRLITRGDGVPQNDPPVGCGELLGRVARVRRRDLWVAPARLSALSRILAWIFSYSGRCRSLALRMRAGRDRSNAGLLNRAGHWPEGAQT